MGLEIVNSPWAAHVGTERGPYGPHTATYDARVVFF